MLSDSGEESDYYGSTKRGKSKSYRRGKRQKRKTVKDEVNNPVLSTWHTNFPTEELLFTLRGQYGEEENDVSFDQVIEPFIPSFISARDAIEQSQIELDDNNVLTRPLRTGETALLLEGLVKKDRLDPAEAVLLRKIKVEQQRHRRAIKAPQIGVLSTSLTPLPSALPSSINEEVLTALYNVKTTPLQSSFLSRLIGIKEHLPPGLVSVDWETRTPWMNLLADIREHHTFAHPEREVPDEPLGPITYSTLHAYQLPQIHELLERSFWNGIDVSDSLSYQPEKCTIVTMYKKIVVGVAIIMSPIQTYITYLAVKAGWDKSQIARTMLYHLISMHPDKDFTLHVSTNNSAMLLYNQYGFKAEEFVAGFYAEYLDPDSRASKNAFKLRLRHI